MSSGSARSRLVIYLLFGLAAAWFVSRTGDMKGRTRVVPYTQILRAVEAGDVESIELSPTAILARLRAEGGEGQGGGELLSAERLPDLEEKGLLAAARDKGVPVSGRMERPSVWTPLLVGWMVTFFLFFMLSSWMRRRAAGGGGGGGMLGSGGPFGFGRTRARRLDGAQRSPVTFDDVAGVEEAKAELAETIDFLRNPGRYRALGARIPKGVLLLGPPGTGKTLLAKAVAGEAGVPFFSVTGPEFVEMFVGVGAARVRDLFEQASKQAPCIVFVDEIDAIGKARGGAAVMAGNDEREQTLNQLLAEMDGFDGSGGIVVIAATNRPEVLDPALVRSGRFDRQVIVPRPALSDRRAILAVHVRQVVLGDDVDLDVVARRTPGMVGADLAKLVNEAALAAARRDAEQVEAQDFETAIDRIQLGLERRSAVMSEDERRRVAVHEAGHAVVAMSVKHADPVHRVTIIPRSVGALGATLQLPERDRHLSTRAQLLDRLTVLMGGRAAEELVLGDLSTGAENDLEQATALARRMVTRYGMSDLGPRTFDPAASPFLPIPGLGVGGAADNSPATAAAIDRQIRSVLTLRMRVAREILTERRALLDALAERLLAQEDLDADDLAELLEESGGPPLRLAAPA